MGQESSKPVWPKPAGGYQSSTGRRYGRRHAYVSFRPSTSQQERIASQGKTTSEVAMHRSAPSQTTKRSRSPFSTTRRSWHRESSGTGLNVDNEDYSRYPPREYRASGGRRGMAYGHIDSYGADDSEEEGAGPVERLPVRGKASKFKDDKLYDPEKGARSLAGVPPQFSGINHDVREELDELDPAPATRCSAGRAEFLQQNSVVSQMSCAEGKVATNGDSLERERRKQNLSARPGRAPVSMCGGGENTPKNAEEPVVRPKVRNLASPNCVKPKIFFDTDDDDDMPHSTSRWRDTANADEGHSDGLARRGRGESSSLYSEPKYPENKREVRNDQVKPEKVPRRRRTMADPDFWTYTDDYYKYCDEDSDSDKEWIAALRRKYRSREQTLSSSGESWETLPGKEEREPPQARVSDSAGAGTSPSPSTGASAGASASSNGSSYPEEVREPSLQEGEQASLEEGEIPWLQYNENSSEGDNDSGQDLMQPGVFMLDGNNNLEDDSSVSEDLEVDWSLFDGFADGLGVAEAISYVDPQFLTYMALEERLAQAMETALAHLESLAVDVEVANPPASKENIDALPEILVTEDHGAIGQEMCCPICCSEYVKGEVATELPCHHYFHKPCVSIWLQKSGTCPVCRCMFPPPL
ncbi:PREDICTED: E3 ubiquitin-protein ligase Praja-1 isoform X1 [Galeopterus variegatus]|uniref:E3 ubiquitin-protein ligase Praja-1 isoform X1 n=2 Tax=Galeopterus variegatus TaxID=482537 RepID=A0ABM0QI07_GALVR|nr:PREDICTED: E3 ubiquitin-protein ligase Praja-1 isoform X1 [Galeopterus variegatus]